MYEQVKAGRRILTGAASERGKGGVKKSERENTHTELGPTSNFSPVFLYFLNKQTTSGEMDGR